MQFMLMFADSQAEIDKRRDPVNLEQNNAAWMTYIGAMMGAGVMKNGDGLLPPETATTVRVREGKRQVQDGPYCDAKEYLGGYCIIEVASLDDALDWAAQAPTATIGSVEVRPVLPNPNG
ncbi:MAG: YciI family protein [Pseudomonadota bacterium]